MGDSSTKSKILAPELARTNDLNHQVDAQQDPKYPVSRGGVYRVHLAKSTIPPCDLRRQTRSGG